MKIIALLIALLLAIVAIRFYMLGQNSKTGDAPGLADGTLTPCPDKPNCVCSEFPADSTHYTQALPLPANPAEALPALEEAIRATGGVVQASTPDYLAATYTSGLFGFVDDLEARLDSAGQVIQLRSASRVGHSDLGANKKRVESLRAAFAAALGKAP